MLILVRKRRDRKMEALKVKSGRMLLDTSVIGRITARRASEFSSTRMETSTRVCGLLTKDMGKVPTGAMKATS